MKKTLKKLLVCILIVLILNNFFFNNISFAADDSFGEWLADMLGAVVGLLTWPIRMIALACAWAIDGVTTNVALLEGYVDANGNIVETNPYGADEFKTLTPFHILFNKIALLDVNFFNILDNGSVVSNIRNSIAGWYYVMRMIAAAILLCVLIYVGIRMAITTIASDKAAYKKMLVDWVCSLALIFLLQYIILFTFAVNEAFIKALSSVSNSTELINAMQNIKVISKGISAASIAATIVFCMLTAQTLALLFSYFKRMLKIAFLVIIAPLITLTYSMDKMGDGKAQALTAWLKEFIYTVLLQTFHCIIYTVFVGMALSILEDGEITRLAQLLNTDQDSITIAGSILAIFCVKFTKDAEEILGKIFDFKGSTGDSSIGAGMLASAAMFKSAGKIGSGTKSAINGVKNLNLGAQARNARVAAAAVGASLFGVRNSEGKRERLDANEALDYANTKVTNKEAAKLEKKNAKGKYGISSTSTKYQNEVKEKADELMKNSGMTAQLAKATARAQIAQKARESKKEGFYKRHKVIGGARGTVRGLNEARKAFRKSETGKFLSDMGKATVAIGVGTFAGSATYGVSGNMFNAFTLGAGAMKGTQELLKTSTATLTDSAHDIFEGMGITNAAEAENEMNVVRAMSPILGDNTELQRQLDELLKFVEGAFSNKDDATSAKTSIKNTVAKQLKQNPNMTTDQLKGLILDDLAKNPNVGQEKATQIAGLSGFDKGINETVQMQRRKELYDLMQSGTQLGFTEDTFTRIVTQGYNGGNAVSNSGIQSDIETGFMGSQAVINDVVNNGEDITNENVGDYTEGRTEEGLGEIRQGILEARQELEDQINKMDAGPEREKLEEESLRLLQSLQAIDGHVKAEIEPAIAKYKANYEEAMSRLLTDLADAEQRATEMAQNRATLEAQRKFDIEVAKIKQEAETYRARLEQNFGREHGVGVYSSEFVDIMKDLNTSGKDVKLPDV